MSVFAAQEEAMLIGVYSTKEKAIAACETWAGDDAIYQETRWRRYDGKWERMYKRSDSNWLMLYVTEAEIDE